MSNIVKKIQSIIAEELDYKLEDIAFNKPLSEFGIDSIIALQMLDEFKNNYDINDSRIIFESKNILDLANKIINFRKDIFNIKTPKKTLELNNGKLKDIQYKQTIINDIEWFIFNTDADKNLILLPPLNTEFHVWIQQISFFKKSGYNIYIPHYPGHGKSRLDGKINLDELSNKLAKSFKIIANNIQKVDLIGWSIGGCLGMLLSIKKQLKIEKLILINCLPKFNQDIFSQSLELRKELSLNEDYLADLYGDSKNNIINFISASCSMEILKEYYDELQKFDVINSLSNVSSETLIIVGSKDPVIEEKEIENFYNIQQAFYKVFKNGGHFIPLTQPFLCNQLLKKFLENQPIKHINNETIGDYKLCY